MHGINNSFFFRVACGVSARRRLFVNGTSAHFVALVCAHPLFVFSAIDAPSPPISVVLVSGSVPYNLCLALSRRVRLNGLALDPKRWRLDRTVDVVFGTPITQSCWLGLWLSHEDRSPFQFRCNNPLIISGSVVLGIIVPTYSKMVLN